MFDRARLKLTLWYLLIVMLISTAFSIVIYKVLTKEFERFARIQRLRIEGRIFEKRPILPHTIDPELVRETKKRLGVMLILVNAGIVVLSGATGYFLAGRTLAPIQEMVDEQNRFISDASHELKTPLTSLKTAMEVFLRNKNYTHEEAKTLIAENIQEVNKLQHLSEELLHLAYYEKPTNNTLSEICNLDSIIVHAIKKVSPIAKQKRMTIVNRFDTETVHIRGNKDALVNLFVILLDNAIKYAPAKTTITITARKTTTHIALSITDQGIGISEKDIPHIFNRFYRADTSRSKIDGYGLGLAIAQKIVDAHKGSIQVKSMVQKESTFTVTLPTL